MLLKAKNTQQYQQKEAKMTLKEIYEMLDSISPFDMQESWDNSGINLGHKSQEISEIFISLEADLEIATKLSPNSLLITHHPLIFSPLKIFDTSNYPAKILRLLIQKNCALIAMHTNFDKTHLNEYFAKEILGFGNASVCSDNLTYFCATAPIHISTLAKQVKSALSLSHITYSTPQEDFMVSQVYVVCGSAASFWNKIAKGEIKPDIALGANTKTTPQNPKDKICLITSDIKYHDAMSAKCANIALIDATHYASERHFAKILHNHLQNKRLNCIMLENFSPFSYV